MEEFKNIVPSLELDGSNGEKSQIWACIEYEYGDKNRTTQNRVIKFGNVDSRSGQGIPDIGDSVTTYINGQQINGVLICSSEMGLTPIDLFNDILVSETDLKAFLSQNKVKECSANLPGMIIQAYVIFCKTIGQDPWDNVATEQTWPDETGANLDFLDFDLSDDNSDDDSSNSSDSDQDYILSKKDPDQENDKAKKGRLVGGPKKTTLRKKGKRSRKSFLKNLNRRSGRFCKKTREDDDEINEEPSTTSPKKLSENKEREIHLLENVDKSCDLCNQTTWKDGCIEFFKLGNQTDLDRVMSKHKLKKHNVRDICQTEVDRTKELRQKYAAEVPEPSIINGVKRTLCVRNCNSDFSVNQSEKYYRHLEYHDNLAAQGMQCISTFPCINCHESFETYGALSDHVDHLHPEFIYGCVVIGCSYQGIRKYCRQGHYNLVHLAEHRNISYTCEICGKHYNSRIGLKDHMQTHNPENEITCEFCGKKYANRAKYQCHYKRIHSGKVYECTSCIQKFIRKEHLEAHLVRDHGEERKYCCQYCGARFIQDKHCYRHVRQFHENTENPRNPQKRERSANKKPYKQNRSAPATGWGTKTDVAEVTELCENRANLSILHHEIELQRNIVQRNEINDEAIQKMALNAWGSFAGMR